MELDSIELAQLSDYIRYILEKRRDALVETRKKVHLKELQDQLKNPHIAEQMCRIENACREKREAINELSRLLGEDFFDACYGDGTQACIKYIASDRASQDVTPLISGSGIKGYLQSRQIQNKEELVKACIEELTPEIKTTLKQYYPNKE